MFELRQLQCFVAVGEELHFGRAAKRLNMTQPPLSRQIQMLEHELAVQLLERTTRSVILTRAGEAFLADAVRMLRSADVALHKVTLVARGETAPVRLGFTAGASYEFLPKLLTRTRAALPHHEVLLRQMTSREQLEGLRTHEIDIGLFRTSDVDGELDDDLETFCVMREQMLLAIPSQHRLAKGRLPRIADLDREPFITFSQRDGYYFHKLIGSFFTQAAVYPEYILHVSQIHSILALVGAGLGISMIPESSRGLHYRGVVLRAAKEGLPRAELHVVWRTAAENPSVAALVQIARQLARVQN